MFFSFFGSTKFLIEPVKSSSPSRKTSLQLVHFKFDVRTPSAVDETASKTAVRHDDATRQNRQNGAWRSGLVGKLTL